ncbi:MAG: ribosome silencing factor [Rickettsiales bacterium]|nr:ribosome silencing factor [Pseudomonadota bacterium]MDA0967399.1 ribosome silencing factor [Pseudomonadota bacterium]MDG4544422.1 ribosome silencing factor [Rickettsiales bacterium]MDG4546552.1 ribosome silencing factor [Rickettsiales bacterium]MDG4548698.1 ribosome silencing factor [Rickettsiales bacterium]
MQNSLEDGKAENIVTVDLHGKSDIADLMVIASGTSSKHSSFLAEKLIQQIKEYDSGVVSCVEGLSEGNWVLVDAGDIIIHIFKPEIRQMYNLEKMWSVCTPEAELVVN